MRRVFDVGSPAQMRNIFRKSNFEKFLKFSKFPKFWVHFFDFLIFGYSSHTVTYNYLNFIYKLQLSYSYIQLGTYWTQRGLNPQHSTSAELQDLIRPQTTRPSQLTLLVRNFKYINSTLNFSKMRRIFAGESPAQMRNIFRKYTDLRRRFAGENPSHCDFFFAKSAHFQHSKIDLKC